GYLTRFRTRTAVPVPCDGVGLVQVMSSPLIMATRFCDVPSQFGKLLPVMLSVTELSLSTVYVPNEVMVPATADLFSSAVPASRFFDANFMRSARTICVENWPLGRNMNEPTGFAPIVSVFFPSLSTTSV